MTLENFSYTHSFGLGYFIFISIYMCRNFFLFCRKIFTTWKFLYHFVTKHHTNLLFFKMMQSFDLQIKQKVKTPFKGKRLVSGNLFLSFLDFLIHFIFEFNLCWFIILKRKFGTSRILANSGIVLTAKGYWQEDFRLEFYCGPEYVLVFCVQVFVVL